MNYILDQNEYEEYLALKGKRSVFDTLEQALGEARDFMLKQADYICVHDREGRYVGYCDDCPCYPIDHNDYQLWKLICGKTNAMASK